MRSTKDRRGNASDPAFPLEDSENELVMEDRRKKKDRRLEKLELEERQLLLSEMPWLTSRKSR